MTHPLPAGTIASDNRNIYDVTVIMQQFCTSVLAAQVSDRLPVGRLAEAQLEIL